MGRPPDHLPLRRVAAILSLVRIGSHRPFKLAEAHQNIKQQFTHRIGCTKLLRHRNEDNLPLLKNTQQLSEILKETDSIYQVCNTSRHRYVEPLTMIGQV